MLANEEHGIQLEVHPGEKELLVEVFLGERKQQVSVTIKASKSAGCQLIKLLSRACVVNGHQVVRSALTTNSNLELGGLCIEMSTDPPVVDVVHNLVASDLIFQDFAQSLYSVAFYADQIENRMMGGEDVF